MGLSDDPDTQRCPHRTRGRVDRLPEARLEPDRQAVRIAGRGRWRVDARGFGLLRERQPVEPELRRRYPVLPENVHVVGHDSPLNTYGLMRLCRSVLIYGTKTGVELTPLGQPVVVAADAWIRGKGLTLDASTKDEYAELLERAPTLEPLDEETVARARRYS